MTHLHIGNRTILLVGDSTMGQSATTLMSMIAASHGSCASQVTYYRSYYLYYPTEGEVDMRDIVMRLRGGGPSARHGRHLRYLGQDHAYHQGYQETLASYPADVEVVQPCR